MLWLGWLLITASVVMLLASFAIMLRTNADQRVPYFRSVPHNPPGSIAVRSVSVGFFVFGSAILTPTFGAWIPLMVFAVPLAGIPAAIAVHNRSIAGTKRSPE